MKVELSRILQEFIDKDYGFRLNCIIDEISANELFFNYSDKREIKEYVEMYRKLNEAPSIHYKELDFIIRDTGMYCFGFRFDRSTDEMRCVIYLYQRTSEILKDFSLSCTPDKMICKALGVFEFTITFSDKQRQDSDIVESTSAFLAWHIAINLKDHILSV